MVEEVNGIKAEEGRWWSLTKRPHVGNRRGSYSNLRWEIMNYLTEIN